MNREQWLKDRLTGIGGSDASAILGLNPWKTNVELWEEKTFGVQQKVSSNKAIEYGTKAEKPLFQLFKLDFPQYKCVKTNQLLRNPEYPFIIGTLDGDLVEKSTKREGVLEIKTTEILSSMHREKWKDKIPPNYYTQIIHYLLVTGRQFAVLKAQLKYKMSPDDVYSQTKHYFIERGEVEEDIKYLLEKEKEFWSFVVRKQRPGLVLPEI